MPKPSSSTFPTPVQDAEIVTAGQPSRLLLAKLKQIGGEVADDQIIHSYIPFADRQRVYLIGMIEFGLLLFAKKQTLKHGQWGGYLTKLSTKLATAAKLRGGDSPWTFRSYAFVAQHFLADLEQGQIVAGEVPTAITIAPADVATYATLPHSQRVAVTEAISAWVDGRSLRQMLSDLRRADLAAEREDTEELPRGTNPPHRKTAAEHRAEGEAALTAPEGLPPEQLQLWTDFTVPLHSMDTLLKDDTVASRSNKELWKAVVAKLQDQLRQAKDRLETIAD